MHLFPEAGVRDKEAVRVAYRGRRHWICPSRQPDASTTTVITTTTGLPANLKLCSAVQSQQCRQQQAGTSHWAL